MSGSETVSVAEVEHDGVTRRTEIRLLTPWRDDGRTISAGVWNSNRPMSSGVLLVVPDAAALDEVISALQDARRQMPEVSDAE